MGLPVTCELKTKANVGPICVHVFVHAFKQCTTRVPRSHRHAVLFGIAVVLGDRSDDLLVPQSKEVHSWVSSSSTVRPHEVRNCLISPRSFRCDSNGSLSQGAGSAICGRRKPMLHSMGTLL